MLSFILKSVYFLNTQSLCDYIWKDKPILLITSKCLGIYILLPSSYTEKEKKKPLSAH